MAQENAEFEENVWLDRVLDAKGSAERYDVICSIKGEITDNLIDEIATVMDLSIPEGDLDERYRQLKECVSTISRYETDRLR